MWRRAGWILLATLIVASVTVAVFLIRSRDPGATNWPLTFELGSSDNGVLFQFSSDVVTGRPLAWTFSPQVFVFPEIPISLIAYLLAGGAAQLYFVIVAAINNAILFLALFAVIRYLYPVERLCIRLIRTGIAALPLILLPLIGTVTLFEFALAPTYYYGMYVVIIVGPVLFLARRPWVVALLGLAIAFTIASNPLTLVFTIPDLVIVLAVVWVSSGFRSIRRPAALAAAVLVLALLVRVVLFAPLQGVSPLSYIDSAAVAGRVQNLIYNFQLIGANGVSITVVSLGALCAIGGFVTAIVIIRRILTRGSKLIARQLLSIYFGLVPLTGLATASVLLILNYLYLWPILIAPMVFALLRLPARAVPGVATVAAAGLVVTTAVTALILWPSGAPNYLSYRSSETRCLDAKLPRGITVGYAGYFEARRLELTSTRPFRLIQIDYPGTGAYYWLSNRDDAADDVGHFFYIDRQDNQTTITVQSVEQQWGAPSSSFTCGPGQTVLIYDSPATLARMHATYSVPPAP